MARIIYLLKIDSDNGGQYFGAIPDQLHVFEKKSDAKQSLALFNARHKNMYGDAWEDIPCEIIELIVNNEKIEPDYH